MAELAGSLSETFQSSLTKSAEGQFQQLAASLARTAELLDRMNNQSQSTQEGLGTLLARLDESQRGHAAAADAQRQAVEDMVAAATNTVHGATVDVVRQTGDASVELSARVREILDRQANQADAADAARESLDEATQRVRTLLSETSQVVGRVAPMVSDLAAASRDLRSVSEVAHLAEQKLQQVVAQFAQQGTTLDQTPSSARRSMK